MATIKAPIIIHVIEGHDVEKATEMVDAMQSSRVGAAYLALTVAHAQIVHG